MSDIKTIPKASGSTTGSMLSGSAPAFEMPGASTTQMSDAAATSKLSGAATAFEMADAPKTPKMSATTTSLKLSPTAPSFEISGTSTAAKLSGTPALPTVAGSKTVPEFSDVPATPKVFATTPTLEMSPTAPSFDISGTSTIAKLPGTPDLSTVAGLSTVPDLSGAPTTPKVSCTTTTLKLSPAAPSFEISSTSTAAKLSGTPALATVAGSSTVPELSGAPTTPKVSEQTAGFEPDLLSSEMIAGISSEEEVIICKTKMTSIDLPGHLSRLGPRHDNDSENIAKIKVLPTMGECQATRPEYLPRMDTPSFHESRIQGYLDAQFRLQRRNCIAPLVDTARESWLQLLALSDELHTSDKGMELYRAFGYSKKLPPTNTFNYFNLEILNVEYNEERGLQIADVRFSQPATVQQLVAGQRARWWSECGRLGSGSLLCMMDSDGHQLYCSPLDEPSFPVDHDREEYCKMTRTIGKGSDAVVPKDLYSDRYWAYTRLRVTSCAESSNSNILRFITNPSSKQCLVEQPSTLLDSFQPTLRVLKEWSLTEAMPFADVICPSGKTGLVSVPPPKYATKDFAFNLRSLMKDGKDVFFSPHKPFNADVIREGSRLDDGQAQALISALTSKIALIQGPPGTGKSFTGEAIAKVLLDNREQAQLGPLVIMAQTNHALDEVLERLKAFCPEGVIRVGAGSKSKSVWLGNCNLKKHAFRKASPRDQHGMARLRAERKIAADKCEALLRGIKSATSDKWVMTKDVEELLASIYPDRHFQIFGDKLDQRGDARGMLQAWINAGAIAWGESPTRSLLDLQNPDFPIQFFDRQERVAISDWWFEQRLAMMRQEYDTAAEDFQQANEGIQEIRNGQDLKCLQEAKVIGVTTSALTLRKKTFDRLESKAMICEEAGEVLEANAVAAFYQSLEHIIMIGDHQQLRPRVQHDMSIYSSKGKLFSLDISLFERLVGHPRNDSTTIRLPVTTLSIQRRMHPTISRFTRLQYEDLADGQNVHNYPEVAGMKDRLYWVDHTQWEDAHEAKVAEANPSASNDYEVKFVCALVEHLVRQGKYESKDIAVVVPYSTQELKIRNKLSKMQSVLRKGPEDLEDDMFSDDNDGKTTYKARTDHCVRISTVDNFQGEEAKIIIASLTRSNPSQSQGFLSFDARINVLMSRAKHGLYIFGSRKNFNRGNGTWPKIIEMFEKDNLIGMELRVECPRHPKHAIIIREPEDFITKAPQGGCDQMCEKPLPCGHPCREECHSDVLHEHSECKNWCDKVYPRCGHQCTKPCSQECDKVCNAVTRVPGRKLPCGHDGEMLPCRLTKFLSDKNGNALTHNPASSHKTPLDECCREEVLKVHPNCEHEHIQRVPCGKNLKDCECSHVDAEIRPFEKVWRQPEPTEDSEPSNDSEGDNDAGPVLLPAIETPVENKQSAFDGSWEVDCAQDLSEPSCWQDGWKAPVERDPAREALRLFPCGHIHNTYIDTNLWNDNAYLCSDYEEPAVFRPESRGAWPVHGFGLDAWGSARFEGERVEEDCLRLFQCGHIHKVAKGERLWKQWVLCDGFGEEVVARDWVWPEPLHSESEVGSSSGEEACSEEIGGGEDGGEDGGDDAVEWHTSMGACAAMFSSGHYTG